MEVDTALAEAVEADAAAGALMPTRCRCTITPVATSGTRFMRFDGPPLTRAQQAAVQKFVRQHFTPNLRPRRRPLREPWERAFGPVLEVTIVVDRERVGWVATVPRLGVRVVADAYTDAISRAALAVLQLLADGAVRRRPPCSVAFEVVRAKTRFIRYAVDPRTPEERANDEALYELAEAGKLFRGFKPPKPRKRARRRRSR